MKIEVGGGCFIAIVIFFLISGLLAILKSEFGIGMMMIAGGAVGLIRYILNQQNNSENQFNPPLVQKQKTIHPEVNQKPVESDNKSAQSLYKPYKIVWMEVDGSEKIPLLFDEEDINKFKIGTPFKYDQNQLFAALIFVYGSPAYRNELSNEEIETLIIKTASGSTHNNQSQTKYEIDNILFEVCEEVMEGCASAFSFDFMIVYNVGAFKLTGNPVFRRNATADLYNLIQSEASKSSMRISDKSFLLNTKSFEINVDDNKIKCKDDRMQYAVNIVLNESISAGLPDFNAEEKQVLMKNFKMLLL